MPTYAEYQDLERLRSISRESVASTTSSYVPKVVLVTGAAGFIGSHVADVLLERGDRVVAVDEMNDYYDTRLKKANVEHLRSTYPRDRFTMYTGDICNHDFINMVFERERPTHICHLAARAGVRPSIMDPYIYVHSNIDGTTRMLDMARKYNVQNFVYASSSSVYGSSQEEVLKESDAVDKPVSPYAATKIACELLAHTFHHLYGINCTGLRFFTVYGPFGRPDMAPFKFIDRVYRGKPIQQFGDGTTSRDYTYIDDITEGVVLAIDKPLGCEVLNLGNGDPYLLKDFIGLVEKYTGKQAIIEVLPEQPGDVQRTCADISKARELLGYNPKTSFEEGIKNTAEWFKTAYAEGLFKKELEIGNISVSTQEIGNGSLTSTASSKSPISSFRLRGRTYSDLELSSYVEPCLNQCSARDRRIFSMKACLTPNVSNANLSLSTNLSSASLESINGKLKQGIAGTPPKAPY